MNEKNRSNERVSGNLRLIMVLVMLALVALALGGTALAQGGRGGAVPPNRAPVAWPEEEARGFNAILQNEIVPNSIAVPNGCVSEASGLDVVCTAKDVSLATTVTGVTIDDDGCAFPGDTVTFTATFQAVHNANSMRTDIGIYFSSDGDPNADGAESGTCSIGILSPTLPQPDDGDLCGDLDATNSPKLETIQTITVLCEDTSVPSDGLLDIPYCTTWRIPGEDDAICNNPTQAFASNKAKCNCPDAPITVPIAVPPIRMDIEKSGPAEFLFGQDNTYTLVYTNLGDNNPTTTNNAINNVITDQLPKELALVPGTFVFVPPNPAPPAPPIVTCTYGAPYAGINPYGGTITCNDPGPLPEEPNTAQPNDSTTWNFEKTITFQVTLDPAVQDFGTIKNTACVKGFSSLRPTQFDEECDEVNITVPVTVAYFFATKTSTGATRFEWSTATETGNAGFNLYVRTPDGLEQLNDDFILSQVVDSATLTDYSIEIANAPDGEFYIEDVSLDNEIRYHGPFVLGEPYGERVEPEPIDWEAINAENTQLEQERAVVATQSARMQTNDGISTLDANAVPAFELRVRENGIYRLTYEQIKAETGIDLAGTLGNTLAVTNRGVPVPIYVSSNKFGPGAYIEFYGEGLDTLYTATNVYRLEINSALASRVAISRTRLQRNPIFAPYYMETAITEVNDRYNYRSPNGDPFYDELFQVNSTPLSKNFTVNVDNYVNGAAPASALINLWGLSDIIAGPDHHARVTFNGVQVADELFDYNDIVEIDAAVPNGTLVNGVNTLTVTAPADRGAKYDMFALDYYGVTYPRAFVAIANRLDFQAAGQAFRVTGLGSNQVVAYRLDAGRPTLLNGLNIESAGSGYAASFVGGEDATYYVSTVDALLKPEIRIANPNNDITSGSADLLIIAHPNFLEGFGPLVAAREAQGYAVKLVNVEDVYAQFSGGVFDAQAIHDYIKHAINNMGVEYIILGGGDTYDYHNYLKKGSVSFIPSFYAETIKPIMMAPVDPLYTDVNGDKVPDAAIGRFPVRTEAELMMMVDKTLAYGNNANPRSLVLAADNGFQSDSELFASEMVTGRTAWNIERAYISALGAEQANVTLVSAMNEGPRLVSFVGHSGPSQWTSNRTTPLFTAGEAAALSNANPMVISQWGCWNAYYVDPALNTLGHNFLLSGNNGAAAVAGSTTVTNSNSERALGELLMPLMTSKGMPLGAAMQAAKSQLALSHPEMVDVLLGWTVLGDPTVVVQP